MCWRWERVSHIYAVLTLNFETFTDLKLWPGEDSGRLCTSDMKGSFVPSAALLSPHGRKGRTLIYKTVFDPSEFVEGCGG